jgi:hypothetical protein
MQTWPIRERKTDAVEAKWAVAVLASRRRDLAASRCLAWSGALGWDEQWLQGAEVVDHMICARL